MVIGRRIEQLRAEREMTQRKLSIEADLSLGAIAKIEQDQEGENNVRLDTLKKLAKAFGLTLSQLLEGVD